MTGVTFADSLADAGRPRAPHPAVLRELRQPGDVQGRLVAVDADAARPVAARPRAAEDVRARRLEARRRPGRAVLPARRLLPGQRPVGRATRRRSRSCRPCSGRRPRSTTSSRCSPGSRRSSGSCRRSARRRRRPTTATCRTSRPGCVPRIYNHSYTISADLHIPEGGAEGVIVADASHLGGFSLFVAGREAEAHLRLPRACSSTARSPRAAADGRRQRADGRSPPTRRSRPPPATSRCSSTANRSAAAGWITPCRSASAATPGLDVGRDNGLVVDRSYADKAPFAFTGTVKKVVFDVAPHLDDRGRARPPRARLAGAHRPRHRRHREAPTHERPTTQGRLDRGLPHSRTSPSRTSTRVLKLVDDKTHHGRGRRRWSQKDADGEVHVIETGDHLGRKGAKLGGGVGLVVGLLRAAAARRDRGRRGRRRGGRASSPSTGSRAGSARSWTPHCHRAPAGVIAIYDSGGADAVDNALANAVRKSVAADRRRERQGAQGRTGRGSGRHGRLTQAYAEERVTRGGVRGGARGAGAVACPSATAPAPTSASHCRRTSSSAGARRGGCGRARRGPRGRAPRRRRATTMTQNSVEIIAKTAPITP